MSDLMSPQIYQFEHTEKDAADAAASQYYFSQTGNRGDCNSRLGLLLPGLFCYSLLLGGDRLMLAAGDQPGSTVPSIT